MRHQIALAGLALVSLALLAAGGQTTESKGAGPGTGVAYPQGYRDWKHLKSMLIQEGHPLFASFGGLHHLYANEKALQGYRSGAFPDGAVIAFDLLEAQAGANAITEGPRKVLGVMAKNSARFASTGGWGFEGFAGGDPKRRAVADMAADCYGCHASEKAHDYVFSRLRD